MLPLLDIEFSKNCSRQANSFLSPNCPYLTIEMRLINKLSFHQMNGNSELCIYEVSYQTQSCCKNPTADLDPGQGVLLGQWSTLREKRYVQGKVKYNFWLSSPLKKLLSNIGTLQFALFPKAW